MFGPVGILGLGYLGSYLYKLIPENGSWGTKRNISNREQQGKIETFAYDWGEPKTWNQLPHHDVDLLLTIPPLLENPDNEVERLVDWCEWMKVHRSNLTNLVYISSTGVYPNLSGIWDEDQVCEPESNSGKLRLVTEKVLSQYFDCKVIRPGAIYGANRHIAQRLLRNEPLYASNRIVHRIHVKDLAAIVLSALKDRSFPEIVNAVDKEASTSLTVLLWMIQNIVMPKNIKQKLSESLAKEKDSTSGNPIQRRISNDRLLHQVGYSFQFPDFRMGMKDSLADSPLS